MYWYYLTVKILLWVVLQVKEEEDQGPCTGTILLARFYSG